MTLATKMWVTSPISITDREELWQLGRELIYRFSDRDGPAEFTDKVPDPRWHSQDQPGVRDRDHGIGQGFCSMYDFQYQLLGYPVHRGGSVVHEDDCEPDCTWDHGELGMDWWIEIALDTTYSFRAESPDGRATWGCGDLHAAIVGILGAFLDSRGVSWHWQNECTGEVFKGRDGLDELGMSGAASHEWMMNVVRPAVESAAWSRGEVVWF